MLVPELGLYVPIGLYLKNPRNYLLDTTIYHSDDDCDNQHSLQSVVKDEQIDNLLEKVMFHHPSLKNSSDTRISRRHRDKLSNQNQNKNVSYRKKPK